MVGKGHRSHSTCPDVTETDRGAVEIIYGSELRDIAGTRDRIHFHRGYMPPLEIFVHQPFRIGDLASPAAPVIIDPAAFPFTEREEESLSYPPLSQDF